MVCSLKSMDYNVPTEMRKEKNKNKKKHKMQHSGGDLIDTEGVI